MTRWLTAVGMLVVLGGGCSRSIDPGTPNATTASTSATSSSVATSRSSETTTITVEMEEGAFEVTRPVGCDSEPGSATDLDSEPASWLVFGAFTRWQDSTGCPVRIDVISHIHGADHCGFQSAEFITIGNPLGASIEAPEGRHRYVWNGEGVIPGLVVGGVVDRSSLGTSIEDTGYRHEASELWLDSNDPTVLYVVADTGTKTFLLEPTAGLCA